MKKFLTPLSFFFFRVAFGLVTVTNTANFETGVNTNGWNCTESRWVSPAYPAPVARVLLAGTNFTDGSALNVAYNENDSLTVTATGGAKLIDFTTIYTLSKLASPEYLQATNFIDSGFSAFWQPNVDAIGYRLNFYTNVIEGASAGHAVFNEAFSYVSGKGNVSQIDNEAFNGLTDTRVGWKASTCYHGINPETGVVQVGSSSKSGHVALPVQSSFSGGGYTLEITARRFKDAGAAMPVSVVTDGGFTNFIGSIALSTNNAVFYLPLPALSLTDEIYIHSTTNKKDGRVVLDGVRILDGYDPGRLCKAHFAAVDVKEAYFATNGMSNAACFMSVTALATLAENDSDESALVELPLDNPPLMPILRACPLTSTEGNYMTSFDALAGITAKANWYNGVSPLPYWMCYRDDDTIVDEIGLATITANIGGLFTLVDELYGSMLGWRGNTTRDFYTGIAFVNASDRHSRNNFRLTFRPCQWNYKNTLPMTNTVEYLVTNVLVSTAAAGAWQAIDNLTITPPYTVNDSDAGIWWGQEVSSTIPDLKLLPGEYLIIRFAHRKASGGVGIANFSLTSDRPALKSCIIFR